MVESIGKSESETNVSFGLEEQFVEQESEKTETENTDTKASLSHKLSSKNLEVSIALKKGILSHVKKAVTKPLAPPLSLLQSFVDRVKVTKVATKAQVPPNLQSVYDGIKDWQSKYSSHSQECKLAQTILDIIMTVPQPTSLNALNERLFGAPNGIWYVDPKSTKPPFNNVFYLFPSVNFVDTVELFIKVLNSETPLFTPLSSSAASLTKLLEEKQLKSTGGVDMVKDLLKNVYLLNPLAGGGPGHTVDVDQIYWINGLGQGAFNKLDLWSKDPNQSTDDFLADCALLTNQFSATIDPVQFPSRDLIVLCKTIRDFQSLHGRENSPAGQLAQTVIDFPRLFNLPIHSAEELQQLFTKYLQVGPDIPANCSPRDLYATFPGVTEQQVAEFLNLLNQKGKEQKPAVPDVSLAELIQVKDLKGDDEKARQYLIKHLSENLINAQLKDRFNAEWQKHMMISGGDSPGLWQQITTSFNISQSTLETLSKILHAQGPWPHNPS